MSWFVFLCSKGGSQSWILKLSFGFFFFFKRKNKSKRQKLRGRNVNYMYVIIQALEVKTQGLNSSCVLSHSVLSNSLRPHRLQPASLLCSWDFPGKNMEWVVISSSRGSSYPGIEPAFPVSPALADIFFTTWEVSSGSP